MKPRRLKGHNAAATCCIAALSRPGVVASAAEDGGICWFDLRCKDVIFTIDVAKEPVSSLCFKAGNENVVYASSGAQISCFDVHMASSTWKPLETYSYNKEEINQIAFSPNSYFLAAADDSGDVKIIDTRQQCLYKTLRGVHSSVSLFGGGHGSVGCATYSIKICSSVQFLSWKSWSVITGGLDSKLAMWDFSRGRAYEVVDYGMPKVNDQGSSSNIGQCFNPAFVHSIALPEIDVQAALNKVCAVARGDGVVDVIQLESEPVSSSKTSVHRNKSQLRSKDGKKKVKDDNEMDQSLGQRVQLDYALGGHTAAVSCVSFSLFGEKGRILISGGNDASVKLWDWSKHFISGEASSNDETVSNINVNKKVIASENEPVRWTTPLGLPVVQPYRKSERHLIRTSLQVLALQRDGDAVAVKQQKTAFPPNFVHSLDGSHMMMTAISCRNAGLQFAGVHDSFWTHACDVDSMNRILREQFVELYNIPILENLHESFQTSFPTLTFPPLPERGEFDLSEVINSPYFFN